MCSFQSTLPGWGATRAVVRAVPKVAISIHAPRMGSDHDGVPDHVPSGLISIHAPRMGSDPMRRGYGLGCWNFNPRSPDGERRMLVPASSMVTVFQSTLPGWGATWSVYVPIWYTLFQSTLPGWGATPAGWTTTPSRSNFNPRSPDGERPHHFQRHRQGRRISIHVPRVGSDPSTVDHSATRMDFNPRSPGGERL